MNDAKQATPAAELERQICSATEPKNEREWWAHREIERLRDRLSVETLALVETLARAEKAEAEVERRESALHLAIMFAVGQLNLSAPAATCLLARSARDKLRQALVDYADAARGES